MRQESLLLDICSYPSAKSGMTQRLSGTPVLPSNKIATKRPISAAGCGRNGVKTLRPHDLRHTFAGDVLDSDADIVTVQQLMGHSSPTTTAGDGRRPAATKRRAVAKLHVPYVRQCGER